MTDIKTVRSLDEIRASIRIHQKNMVENALEIGRDLTEAKETCRHGEWLPWLKSVGGISSSTAANYMKIAREVDENSRIASLPYTKIMALLALPPEERESVSEQAEEMSAAEIRKLTEERNKAAEAANAETVRADQAEADAKRFYDECARLKKLIEEKEAEHKKEVDELNEAIDEMENTDRGKELWDKAKEISILHAQLKAAQKELEEAKLKTATVTVEVPPADYNDLKRQQKELLDAAAEAEQRAAEAEAELEEIRNQGTEQENASKILRVAMTAFFSDCATMASRPESLRRDQQKIERQVEMMENWCAGMREALGKVVEGEAVIA